ncbi:MAG: (2Fe-2S) ferredoxin domain-containing protein [Gluconacetobacter diazotrophicus]|nr:(2Fe-2S) ferredoxin domain-containing protein [Gluconacetobacter diazotrophicus]
MGKKNRDRDPAASVPDLSAPFAEVAAPWTSVLLSCRKCARKLDGGFGPDRDDHFSDVVKRLLRERKQRRQVRLLETGCLGLCPKNAVVVLRAEAPGRPLLVPRGADDAALAEQLLPVSRPLSGRLTPDDPAGS